MWSAALSVVIFPPDITLLFLHFGYLGTLCPFWKSTCLSLLYCLRSCPTPKPHLGMGYICAMLLYIFHVGRTSFCICSFVLVGSSFLIESNTVDSQFLNKMDAFVWPAVTKCLLVWSIFFFICKRINFQLLLTGIKTLCYNACSHLVFAGSTAGYTSCWDLRYAYISSKYYIWIKLQESSIS